MGIKHIEMEKEIAIIIVTYNSQNLLADCLNSIFVSNDINPEKIEVIIVDNSSDNDALEIQKLVENHEINKYIGTKYIHNSANLGYGQGNNIGIYNTNAKILCIMNPDVRFQDSLFQDVILHFQNSNLGLLGYKQLGGYNLSYYLKPEYQIPFITPILIKFINKINSFHSKYLYLSGALLFISKNNFENIGTFDQNIFMYYEEPDIANRFLQNKYDIKFNKKKSYVHLVGKRNNFSAKSFENEILSLKYYLSKFNFSKSKYILKYSLSQNFKMMLLKLLNQKESWLKSKLELQVVKNVLKE